jgi:urease accessory protein
MSSDNWVANLNINLQHVDGHSRLVNPSHTGPLRIQRPFYPEGKSLPHVYILHPPGGIVGGDQLFIDLHISQDAQGLVTTPGATKIYRSDAKQAKVQQTIHLEDRATLEWLPHETIIFDGAYIDSATRINLAVDAKFIGWEIVCFGRPGANETFEHGEVKTRLEIWRNGLPVWLDKGIFTTGLESNSIFHSAWGLNSSPVMATLIASPCSEQLIESLPDQQLLKGNCTISLVEDILVCRYIGACTQEAKSCFSTIWSLLRPGLLDRAVCPPRVWNT